MLIEIMKKELKEGRNLQPGTDLPSHSRREQYYQRRGA
jgi:hypothetical protein